MNVTTGSQTALLWFIDSPLTDGPAGRGGQLSQDEVRSLCCPRLPPPNKGGAAVES